MSYRGGGLRRLPGSRKPGDPIGLINVSFPREQAGMYVFMGFNHNVIAQAHSHPTVFAKVNSMLSVGECIVL
jgi:hypothetical protein